MRKYNHAYLKEYTPIDGFFDLRNWDIPKKEFLSLWNIQKFLASYRGQVEYLRRFDPIQWEELKELSVQYQQKLLTFKLIGEMI